MRDEISLFKAVLALPEKEIVEEKDAVRSHRYCSTSCVPVYCCDPLSATTFKYAVL